jgi:DNA-binding HxlR family transcriptional regulator
MKPHPLRLLEERHSTEVLLFLGRHDGPAITKTIMAAIGVRNWATIASTLRKLEEARLVTHVEARVGKYASRAQMWRLEPNFGVKVAATLEVVERCMIDAASQV